MESSEVGSLIGKEVTWTAKNVLADIVGYEKGWVTIKTVDDEHHKVRAKDLVLMDSTDDIVETEEGLIAQEVEEDGPITTAANTPSIPGEPFIIDCGCGTSFTPTRTESVKCPSCGRWHRVRLHPDLSKYIKGMGETASGRDTVDIDDYVATILRGMSIDVLYGKICIEIMKLSEKARFSKAMSNDFRDSDSTCADYLRSRYGNLNLGMQRMNLGNLLRGALKRQEIINLTPRPKSEGKIEPVHVITVEELAKDLEEMEAKEAMPSDE